MDYSLCDTDCDELLKRYRVALSREEVQAMVEETYAFLAMQMGVDYVAHQPKDGLRKRIGEDLDERVGTCLANQCADRIIAEEGLPAAMEPVVDLVDGFSDDAAFDFEVTVFLKPAWELTSYDPVVLPLPDFEVTEEQVERNVQAIVEDRAKYVEDAEARQVDEHTRNVVSLDTKKCGMPVQALTVDSIVYRLGDGLLPSPVEEQLLGMAPGETKEFSFNVTSKNFLGLDVEETMDCVLRVSRIVKKDTPDVTDAWVKENVPGAHDVESFYALVRRNLTEQARGDYDRIKEESAAHALSQRLPEAEVPEEYCNYARSGLLQNVSAALSLQGLTEEEFLTAQGTTESQFMIQMGMRAREIVRQGLALDALARHLGLEVQEDDLARMLWKMSPGKEDEARKMLEMNGRTYQLHEMALRSKARAYLTETAVTQAR